MWRALETGLRQLLNGHEEGNLGYKPRRNLRATAPVLDPTTCEVTVHDMRNHEVAERAKHLGVRSVPAVLIDGKLANCCEGRGPDLQALRAAGLGVPFPEAEL